jgi:anti-sigma factor RsiW
LADDLVADHLRSVPDVRPAEIASDDRGAILRFFAGHVPFPAVVPELPGAELLGGRLCQIEGRRVELLFYRREERTLSLFVTDTPSGDANCWETRAHHVCSRSHGRTSMLLVGQLPADELRRLLAESTL